jgi:hypothetical protein
MADCGASSSCRARQRRTRKSLASLLLLGVLLVALARIPQARADTGVGYEGKNVGKLYL